MPPFFRVVFETSFYAIYKLASKPDVTSGISWVSKGTNERSMAVRQGWPGVAL